MKRWFSILMAAVVTVALFVVAPAYAATSYTVQPGDTLSGLARQFGTTVNEIVAANNITNPNFIVVGQVLTIPDGATNPPSGGGGGTTSGGGGGGTTSGGGGTYTVVPGDTLGSIAARHGTTVAAIAQLNGIANVNLIYVGQVLQLPSGSTGGSSGGTSGGGGGTVPPPGGLGGGFEIGGQIAGYGHEDQMNYAGFTWVKVQHKWTAGQSADVVAGAIQEAHNKGFKVLISIPGNPYPSSIDFGAYVEFLRGVAGYGPDAIEVWNEMNIDFEWPAGQISPSSYVNNMLAPAYNAIKSVNANILVVSGAPAPTGFDNDHNAWADNRYLAGMAAAGAANYADCIGVHHNAGATSPYQATGHPGGSHYSWYYQPTVDLYYNSFGGARKLCITELGYLSGDGYPGLPANFGWAAGTSVAEHAQWLGEAATLANASGRVRLLIVFNFNFTFYDAGHDPQAGFAMIRPDGSCPACETIRAVTGGR
ncbi:MAG: LysM peptidoglycan-binding domain-containing protein [Anaerolineales bacterium]|nr:LysM peptidoglycan-binding domain-containing protein [Anaerolineales bacterium]